MEDGGRGKRERPRAKACGVVRGMRGTGGACVVVTTAAGTTVCATLSCSVRQEYPRDRPGQGRAGTGQDRAGVSDMFARKLSDALAREAHETGSPQLQPPVRNGSRTLSVAFWLYTQPGARGACMFHPGPVYKPTPTILRHTAG